MTRDFQRPPPRVRMMARFRWMLIAAMTGIAVLSVADSLGWISGGAAGAPSIRYYCPMHPQVVQDQPGDCPICNMTLVERQDKAEPSPPEPAASGSGHGARTPGTSPTPPPAAQPPATSGVPGLVPVELAMDRVQTIGVRTSRATQRELRAELRTVGFVAADETRVARVHARFSGWIERLPVAETGQKVSRGQVLAGLYNLELLPAQREFLAARRWSARTAASGPHEAPPTAAVLEQDARARLELFGLSPAEIDHIAATGQPTRTVAVTAPIRGHVTRKNAVRGAYVEPGTELFEITDLSTVWVLADVYEHELARIHLGLAADLLVSAHPTERFSGKISFIYPTLDPTTRTLRVRIALDNDAMKLRPGMYGDVLIRLAAAYGVVVPLDALVDTGEYQYVFIAKDGGRFEPRRVRVGARSGDEVQILEGVSQGERVVTTANFLVDSESRLRAAIEGPALRR